jgi:hypothetical protein
LERKATIPKDQSDSAGVGMAADNLQAGALQKPQNALTLA